MVEEVVFKEICNYLELSLADISAGSDLESLGIDSIGAITILYELEDKLGVEVPNELFKSIHTVGDIIDRLEKLMQENKSA